MGVWKIQNLLSVLRGFPDIRLGRTWQFRWTGGTLNKWAFFSESEVNGLETETVAKLDRAANFTAIECKALGIERVKYIITSGKRNVEDNQRVGGVDESAHIMGRGMDLRCADSRSRMLIFKGLVLAGFMRIGIYDKHIHVDDAPETESRPGVALWTGISH